MPDAIRTEGLTKYYGRVVGVEDLTLAVPAGMVFGFLGPNGAGKTTTIRLLLDLLRPASGTASLGGFDCQRQGLQARRLVGYLPGELPVYRDLSGHGYLRFLAKAGSRPVSPSTLERLLRRFDVSEVDLHRRMSDYSQGMKRKLGLLQALVTDPPIVILDEPTAGLDPLMIEAFEETVAEVTARGATVFLSSHVLSEVEKTCARIGLIRRGRLVALRSVEELAREAPRRVVVSFAAAVNGNVPAVPGTALIARAAQSWTIDVKGPLGPLVASLRELPVHDIHVEPFSLEEYVRRFYADEGEP